jgi:hypothetical protein
MTVPITPSRLLPPSNSYSGNCATLPLRSHNAVSTAAIALIVTGPRRQYAPRYKYCQVSSIRAGSRPISAGIT